MIITTIVLKKKKPIGETVKMIKTCAYCNKEFEARRVDKHFCSASCRQLNHLQKKAITLFGNESKSIEEPKEVIIHQTTPAIEEESVVIKKEKTVEKQYKELESRFVNDIISQLKRRSIEVSIQAYVQNNKAFTKSVSWINVRLRCLIEILLLISERKSLPLADLVEITNAFTLLLKSEHLKNISEHYPYYQLIKDLRDKLKNIYIENEDSDFVQIKLVRRVKIDLIVYRCELRSVASKVKFSELNFKTKDK